MQILKNIPPLVLFSVVSLLCIGELASGTGVVFVAMVACILCCIAITYNLLGGLKSFSGLLFTAFSLRTIVVSQFVKVLQFDRADINLEAPALTIQVYAVFFFCVMVGVFLYGRLRFSTFKPLESVTRTQTGVLYGISLTVGLAAALALQMSLSNGAEQGRASALHSVSLGLSSLLLFALVIAVDTRIRDSNGKHSFSFAAFVPWFMPMIFGLVGTSRGSFIAPTIVYFVVCFTRGYRFKMKHYLSVAVGIFLFSYYVSPFELYLRGLENDMPFKVRIDTMLYLLKTGPSHEEITRTSLEYLSSGDRISYLDSNKLPIVGRLALIGPDSLLINACSGGYHYGSTALKIDLLHNVPFFLLKNKPTTDSAGFVGRISGVNSDEVENAESAISPISDCYGSFGWTGVVLFPLLVFPLMFVIFDSMFDASLPWGTVALGSLLPFFGEGTTGMYLVAMIRFPIYLVLLSYIIGGIARILAIRGSREETAGAPMIDRETASIC